MSVERHERQIHKHNDAAEKNFKNEGPGSQDKMYHEINSIRKESGNFSSKESHSSKGTDLELSALAIFSKYSTLASELGIKKDSTTASRAYHDIASATSASPKGPDLPQGTNQRSADRQGTATFSMKPESTQANPTLSIKAESTQANPDTSIKEDSLEAASQKAGTAEKESMNIAGKAEVDHASDRTVKADKQLTEEKERKEEKQRMIAAAASLESRIEVEKEKVEPNVGVPQKNEIADRVIPAPVQSVNVALETNARDAKAQTAPTQFIPGKIESAAPAEVIRVAANAESKTKEEAQKAKAEAEKKAGEKQKEVDQLGTFGDMGARHPGRRRKKRKTRRRRVRGRRRMARRRGRGRRRVRGRRGGRRRGGRRGGRRRRRGGIPRNNYTPRNDRTPNPNPNERRDTTPPNRPNPSERQDRQPHRRAVVPPPVQGDMAIKGAPTSTVEQIQAFLEQSNSPAAREQGFAKNLYEACTKRGIDPSVALGFFLVESTMGRFGRGHNNKSLGNIRGRSPESGQTDGQFRRYATWSEGARDWARLIDEAYVNKRGHQTLSQVVRVYCPGSEGSIRKYVSNVKGVVESFKRKNNGRSVA